MKRIVPVIMGLGFLLNAAFSQQPPVLTYETHAILAGADNNMILCRYAEPGDGNENAVWDFSSLKSTCDFTGNISTNTYLKTSQVFNQANIILDEFSNRFFLNVSKDKIEQLGYSAHDNSVIVTYEKPFVKMIFPFTMGDRYTGNFYGSMQLEDTVIPLTGNYEVTADGYGKLKLPGNISVDNALRVKTVKSYEMQVNGTKHFVLITTFRWYGCCNRYPLLVLTTIKASVGSSVSYSYQAAYNNVINSRMPVSNEDFSSPSIRAYPNPVTDVMTFEYTLADPGKVLIEIYNNTGEKIKTLLNDHFDTGTYRIQLVPKNEGLPTGLYIIKADINKAIITEEVVIAK